MLKKRDLIKLSATGILGGAIIPQSWSTPLIRAIVLPAHAQTSAFGPFGQNFTFDAGSESQGSFFFSDEEEVVIRVLDSGTLRGDLVFEVGVGSSSSGEILTYRAVSGSGDAFLDYLFTRNGQESGPFRLIILNLSAS